MSNEDPKTELQALRALLVARKNEEQEQAKRFKQLGRDRDARVDELTGRLVEIDAAIEAINARRRS